MTHTTGGEERRPAAPSGGDEIDALGVLIVLAKHKRSILRLTFGVAAAAVIVSLVLPVMYTGTVRILPPQQGGSSNAAALLSQISGSLGGLAGLAGGSLAKNPSDLYVGMLKSRTVADALIERFKLNELYDEKYQSNTRKALEHRTTIAATKDGIITVEVDDKDPQRSADMANAYADELTKLTNVLAVTEASQRRLFFERQLALAKDNLTNAEMAARQGLDKGGLAYVDAQGRSMVEANARLRAQISAREVQLGAMRTFAAEGNPELQRTQQEIAVLKRELARAEGSAPDIASGETGGQTRTGIDSLARLRNVKYYEFLYELLAKQYELARIDEAKDTSVIQVLDKAIVPDRKSKPYRAVIVIVSTLMASLLSVLWAFFREAEEKAEADPEQAQRLEALRGYLRWKRR